MVKTKFDIQLFATDTSDRNVQVTTQSAMSPTMKTYYDTELLENARSEYYFNQFGKNVPLPKNRGKIVEWRKFNTFARNLTALAEGVIPDGKDFGMSYINATIAQYGQYTSVSDVLDLTAVDDIILGATQEMGAAAAGTQDTLTRNVVVAGSNVAYCPNGSTTVTSRANITLDCILTPAMVNKAFTWLKKQKTPKIKSKYFAIIHPSVAEDLRQSTAWIEAHKYASPEEIFNGEIGELHGVRFIETTEEKIFGPAVISDSFSRLTVAAAAASGATTIYVNEELTPATPSTAIPVYINGVANTITKIEADATYGVKLTIGTALAAALSAGAMVCGTGAGKDGSSVYATMFFGADAWGKVDPEGAGLQMVIKPASEIGGPLEQFSTVGYKFMHAAKILYQERLLRVESGSSYSLIDEEN